MPNWTKEQSDAIYKTNSNIIVSAGAGSGKTAVLSERVIEKLRNNIHINELLILTFTKAAALEMKERIRKKIKKIPELKGELDLIDNSYITTFDSFAMSVVKKYHYLLNVSKDISIIESSVIEIKKKEILDSIMDSYYLSNDKRFFKLINDFCIKDDKDIKNSIIQINNKLDLRIDKISYLTSYLDNYFACDKINRDIDSYVLLLKDKIEVIKESVDNLSLYMDSDYINLVYESLNNLFNSNTYEEIKIYSSVSLPRLPRGVTDDVKKAKEGLGKLIKSLNELCFYIDRDDIYNSIVSTKDYVSVICDIIIKLHNEIMEYKNINNVYEFNDIAIMAINVLDNEEVRNELKYHFKEIMIDEYQDTNDLQENFISKIENNNVYMVGDIKQSIYRFRNANPYIFKNKYDNYSLGQGGIKIDLLKNFRSRNEVLDNINTIFNLIMDDEIGGCNYTLSHQMVFGNNSYINEGKTDQNNNFEVYTYDYSSCNYSKEEIEIFFIANDIKNKVNNKYKVFDKDDLVLRDVTYNDFVILIDRSTTFELYKKIFEYMNIPLSIVKDEKLNTDIDLVMLKNLLCFVIKVKNNLFDTEFKYLFTSIARSFIYNYSDDEIFDYFVNDNFINSPLYVKAREIANNIDNISIRNVIDNIIDSFDYINSLSTIGNINKSLVKLDKIKDICDNLNGIGYNIYTFTEYLKEIIDSDYQMTYSVNEISSNSVKIMTIHKSKGLEYHICYFPMLFKEFNFSDIKTDFLYDNTYGIITPYFDEGIGKTIYKSLLKNKITNEEVSEKIRLFYVALTRAKEKMIMILPINNKDINDSRASIIDKNIRKGYKSFMDIFNSIENYIKSYYSVIDIDKLNISKDYNKIKSFNYDMYINKTNNKLLVNEICINNSIKEDKHFSKESNGLIDIESAYNIKYGKLIHEVFESIDFKNIDLSNVTDNFIKGKINKFISSSVMKNISNAKVYKEYEFIYIKDNVSYHGIIDLMNVYDDYIDIIDYKLKDISDEEYLKQLNGYKNYIEGKFNKKVNIYLYSILDEEVKRIN